MDSNLVAGYYTLSAAEIELGLLPDAVRKRLPRYPALPALLLGRLAVDHRFRGQGMGRRLLYDAFRRVSDIAEQAGVFALIVDAKDDEARTFYIRFGFELTDDPMKLRITLSRIREQIRSLE